MQEQGPLSRHNKPGIFWTAWVHGLKLFPSQKLCHVPRLTWADVDAFEAKGQGDLMQSAVASSTSALRRLLIEHQVLRMMRELTW